MIVLHNDAPPIRVVIEQRPPLVVRPFANTGGGAGGSGVVPVVVNFPLSQSTWLINHNLGRKVDVALFSPGSVKMLGEVVLLNDNQAVASFSQPTAGFARVI